MRSEEELKELIADTIREWEELQGEVVLNTNQLSRFIAKRILQQQRIIYSTREAE